MVVAFLRKPFPFIAVWYPSWCWSEVFVYLSVLCCGLSSGAGDLGPSSPHLVPLRQALALSAPVEWTPSW